MLWFQSFFFGWVIVLFSIFSVTLSEKHLTEYLHFFHVLECGKCRNSFIRSCNYWWSNAIPQWHFRAELVEKNKPKRNENIQEHAGIEYAVELKLIINLMKYKLCQFLSSFCFWYIVANIKLNCGFYKSKFVLWMLLLFKSKFIVLMQNKMIAVVSPNIIISNVVIRVQMYTRPFNKPSIWLMNHHHHCQERAKIGSLN